MDPEPVPDPAQVPQPSLERKGSCSTSNSEETGSNSSLSSTLYFRKVSGSASSSASTSRSPPGDHDPEDAARLLSWPSPPFGGPPEGHKDEQSSNKIPSPSTKDDEKVISRNVIKEDNTRAQAFEQVKGALPSKGTKDLKSSDQKVTAVPGKRTHRESEQQQMSRDSGRPPLSEQRPADACCCDCCGPCCRKFCDCCWSCCRKFCSPADILGNVASVICWPFSIVHFVVGCLCFKCPRLFGKTVKPGDKRGQQEDFRHYNEEKAELEEPSEDKPGGKPAKKNDKLSKKSSVRDDLQSSRRSEESTNTSKADDQQSDKPERPPGFDEHRGFKFFPSPEREAKDEKKDDQPGKAGEKEGGQ